MAYKIIDIPGKDTTLDVAPQFEVINTEGCPIVIIRYYCRYIEEGPALFGQLKFSTVFEYRWIHDMIEYTDFPEHKDDYENGLIEIRNSSYVENLASKGPKRDRTGRRFGLYLAEEAVRHFRIGFDHYGIFEIIALEVDIQTVGG